MPVSGATRIDIKQIMDIPTYATLSPDAALDALASAGWLGDGRLLALNSYENRVYLVWCEDGSSVVVKFYRPGRWSDAQILEEHAFAAECAEAEIPVVPALPGPDGATLQHHAGWRFAVFPRHGGRAPDLEQPETLAWLGRFLGRLHVVGERRPFVERPAIDPDTFGRTSVRTLLGGEWLPATLRAPWQAAAEQALEAVEVAWARCGDVATLRLHGDCHAGNLLWTDDGPHFVDFDDARTGPAVQDLWMLLAGDRESASRQLAAVLTGYETFREFDDRELALVEPLRTLRLLHYSAWIAGRWQDPAFPAAFPWFGTDRYWQDRILELREQIAAMSEPPLVPARD